MTVQIVKMEMKNFQLQEVGVFHCLGLKIQMEPGETGNIINLM